METLNNKISGMLSAMEAYRCLLLQSLIPPPGRMDMHIHLRLRAYGRVSKQCSGIFLLCAVLFLQPDHQAGEGQERQRVGDHHEAVEEVSQGPYQIHFQRGAHDDEENDQQRIDPGCFLSEQIFYIDLRKKVPSQDGGKCEEQQAYGDENIPEAAKDRGKSVLGQGRTVLSAGENSGGQDGEDRQVKHDKGVDKDADHSRQSLLMGSFHGGAGVGVRGGAHTGLIGEQAAGHAEPHCVADGNAGRAAHDGGRLERAHKNHAECFGEHGDVASNDNQAAHDIDAGHDGNQLLHYGGQSCSASDKDEGGDDCQHHAHSHRRDVDVSGGEDLRERRADGIGLYHIAHEAQGQYDKDSEHCRQYFAETAFERGLDIVDGSAGDFAVFRGTEVLGQRGLRVDRGHAEEGAEPHPEDGSRTAAHQSGSRACQIAGPHLGGDGSGHGLEGGHLPFSFLLSL